LVAFQTRVDLASTEKTGIYPTNIATNVARMLVVGVGYGQTFGEFYAS
jgi:hypothetical protein